MSLKLGINNGVSNKEYHGDKNYLSSSSFKTILKDIDKFHKEHVLGLREEKSVAAFDEGSYAHTLILEPHLVNTEFAFFEGMRKQGAEWEQFRLSNPDKIILSKPQKIKIDRLYKSYEKRRKAIDLIKGGFPELTLAGHIMEVPCKVRADYINIDEGYIVDVKTTSFETDQDTFKMTVKQFEYGLSAAMYQHMYEEHYGRKFDFYFLVLGKKDESCEIFKASEQTLSIGMTNLRKALQIYKKCVKTGIWTNSDTNSLSIIDNDKYEILEV